MHSLFRSGLLGKNKYEFASNYCSVKFARGLQGKIFKVSLKCSSYLELVSPVCSSLSCVRTEKHAEVMSNLGYFWILMSYTLVGLSYIPSGTLLWMIQCCVWGCVFIFSFSFWLYFLIGNLTWMLNLKAAIISFYCATGSSFVWSVKLLFYLFYFLNASQYWMIIYLYATWYDIL